MSQVQEQRQQERREADRRKAREAVEALRSSEGWQRWLASRRHFHAYSLANQLLIAMQLPEATRVAGFKAWLKLGYCVRRGETALRIWVPMPPTKKAIEEWRAAGAVASDKPRTRFRLGPVFDRSQVEPLPAPAVPAPLDPPILALEGDELAWAWSPLVDLAGEIGCSVTVERLPNGYDGYYQSHQQLISISGLHSPNHRVATLVHEVGHLVLRAEREADDYPFGYCGEELVVESVAFTVCGSLGLDTSVNSVPYMASWAEGASMETIESAAATIDRVAKRIEDYVLEASTAVGREAAGARR
jgi:antirestriction protein ArdC